MTKTKTKTDAVEAVAETAPERSRARVTLAARIDAREAARQTIEDRQNAQRRLQLLGEAAQALAAQLSGAKAASAASLAAHVLSGSGPAPKLVEDGRADLVARLAEAQERAEAAVPAMETVEAAITAAIAEHHRASAAVATATFPVVQEEAHRLVGEVREVLGQLGPLVARLMGCRDYIFARAHEGGAEDRDGVMRFGNDLLAAIKELRVDPNTPADGTAGLWSALSQRLAIDADARAA